MTKLANRLWGNSALMGYLKSGVFTYKTPLGQVHYEDPDGKPGCDFFGINHYARCHATGVDRLHENASQPSFSPHCSWSIHLPVRFVATDNHACL